MAGKIEINKERCKGCQVCVEICPQGVIEVSPETNKKGYYFARPCGEGCTGCALCALVCPDVAITVYREDKAEAAQV